MTDIFKEKLNAIPYMKEWRKIPSVKSASTAILMIRMEQIFAELNNGTSFYKFLQPCENDSYKQGESWCEELGFSPDEFRTAFGNIAIKYNSLSEYKKAVIEGNPFQEKYYLAYSDKIKGLTFYLRNNELVNKILTT